MSEERKRQRAVETARSVLPVALTGLLIVLAALLFMQWPPPVANEAPAVTGQHLNRLSRYTAIEGRLIVLGLEMEATGGAVALGALLDASIYFVVLAVAGFLVWGWRQGRHAPLLGLVVAGVLGLVYSGGMALFTGPAFSVCGFTLILFGALVAWSAVSAEASSDAGDEDGEASGAEREQAAPGAEADAQPSMEAGEVDSGTNDYASHTVA